MLFNLGTESCRDLGISSQLEWLETNGLGGYASGAVSGLSTRRHHGLLTLALDPPRKRRLLLAGLDEFLHVGGESCALSTHQYPDTVHPDGYTRLLAFHLDPWPVWTFEAGPILLEREVFMAEGCEAVIVRYRVHRGPTPLRMEIKPFLCCRDSEGLTRAHDTVNKNAERGEEGFRVQPCATIPALHFSHSKGAFESQPIWRRDFEYAWEKRHGLEHREDLFSPGTLTLDLDNMRFFGFTVGLKALPFSDVKALASKERTRRNNHARIIPDANAETRRLISATDAYLLASQARRRSVLAGYPWLGERGRDTMIALPGVCINSGRKDEAREVLRGYAQLISQGLIPNGFADEDGVADYGALDATLWYVLAIHRYVDASGDRLFIAEILPVLESIVHAYLEGALPGIRVDEAGLLGGAQAGRPLTWMDARVGERVITARAGQPVEVNALWYNALRIVEAFERKLGQVKEAKLYKKQADRCYKAFNQAFWNQERQCLYDLIQEDGQGDPRIRPNQLFAISLPHHLLDDDRARAVLETVTRELLTPMGLRSLAPGEPDYHARYEGDSVQRAEARHQGSVWPWLMGAYVDAYLAVHGRDDESLKHLKGLLAPLLQQLNEVGINHIPELYDAEAPQRPHGCMGQAWSVGELLRGYQRVVAGDHTPTISGLWPVVRLR